MFSLEIGFKGEPPSSETVFIRRPTALISADESAQVVIDDMASLGYGIVIARDVGRRFRLSPVAEGATSYTPQFLDGVYDGEAVIDLGPVVLRLTALDNDLMPKEGEAPDRAGIRILRQACAGSAPTYPAVLLLSNPPASVSFAPEQNLMVGRSRQCSLRIDGPTISARHARIGFEGGQFWVEDLGSTHGTFVNKQQISGRVNIQPGSPISLGGDVTLVGVLSAEDAKSALATPGLKSSKPVSHHKRYPLLISTSETARPAQLMLTPGTSVVLGRDPSSDMWLGVPHVSRRHCLVDVTIAGVVRITDASTNGTGYDDGLLRKDETTETANKPLVLDFGGGITVGVCFSQSDEEKFIASNGALDTFKSSTSEGSKATGGGHQGTRQRKPTTFLRAPEELRQSANGAPAGNPVAVFLTRLSSKGKIVLGTVVAGVAIVASVTIFSLVSGMR